MAPDGDAPAGALTSADGRRVPFSGWTGLAAAIEDWRRGERTSRPTPVDQSLKDLSTWN
jgi:hypothetical protein